MKQIFFWQVQSEIIWCDITFTPRVGSTVTVKLFLNNPTYFASISLTQVGFGEVGLPNVQLDIPALIEWICFYFGSLIFGHAYKSISEGTRRKSFLFSNVIFPAQAEYSGFSVTFKLTIVLQNSYLISYDISVLDIKTAIGYQLFSRRFLRFVG